MILFTTRPFILLVSLVIAFSLSTCTKEQGKNKFTDQKLVGIYELKNRRSSYQLKQFLAQEHSANYRREAVMAFASMGDTSYCNFIGGILLRDSIAAVRYSAAFALGQMGGQSALKILRKALIRERDTRVRRYVLEGIGKLLRSNEIESMLTFQPADSFEYLGHVWGLYRMSARHVINDSLLRRALGYLAPGFSDNIRIPAAACFAMTDSMNLCSVKNQLSEMLRAEKNPTVKISLIDALVNINSADLFSVIEPCLRDQHWSVRNRAIRALSILNFPDAKEGIEAAMADSNINNRVAAAGALEAQNAECSEWIKAQIRQSPDFGVVGILSNIMFENAHDTAFRSELRHRFDTAQSPYARAEYVEILGRSFSNYRLLKRLVLNEESPIVRSGAAIALAKLNGLRSFPEEKKAEFFDIYRKGIQTNDVALIKIFCQTLSDPYLGYKDLHPNIGFLRIAREKFAKDDNTEILQYLENTIAFFEERKPKKIPKRFKPIDWRIIARLQAIPKVNIQTTRGDVVAELLLEDAPETVAQFVDLIESDYFKGQPINNITSDLLIYFGCGRGDGWSAPGYYMRSEFSWTNFSSGIIGVASFGRDTETTHFFITQIPVFYLDGRYTPFGRIVSGMDVLANLRPGDRIIRIEML